MSLRRVERERERERKKWLNELFTTIIDVLISRRFFISISFFVINAGVT